MDHLALRQRRESGMKAAVALQNIHRRKWGWADGLRDRLAGGTAICLASGPSLTQEDIEAVQAWRSASETGRIVIVANTTYQAALWADVLVFVDRAWWSGDAGKKFGGYRDDVRARFKGVACGMNTSAGTPKLEFPWMVRNSGALAISLAAKLGASRIVMLGYDCQHTGGKTHWHGNHPAGLGNAGSINGIKGRPSWADQFKALKMNIKVPITNASRETALTCFPRATLEESLA
jgi:hypothetical protein